MQFDNQVVIFIVSSKNVNKKMGHMRMRDKFIRNLITYGIISLDFVKSERNIEDLLIKRLMHQQIFESSRGIRLKSIN